MLIKQVGASTGPRKACRRTGERIKRVVLDRRALLKRSGLTAGALAALGNLSARRAFAGGGRSATSAGATVTTRKNICTHCSVGCSVIAEVANGVWIGQEPDYDSPINRGSHCCKGAAVRDDVLSQRRLRYPVKLVNGQWVRISLGTQRSTRSATSCWKLPEVRTGLGSRPVTMLRKYPVVLWLHDAVGAARII